MHKTQKPARGRGRSVVAALVVAALAALAWAGVSSSAVTAHAGLASPATSQAGDSWSTQQQQPALTDLGHIRLVVIDETCNVVNYPDGAAHFSACNQRDYSGGSTWWSLRRKLWNVPLASGGHSEGSIAMTSQIGSYTENGGGVAEGATSTQNVDRQSGSGSTVWIAGTNIGGGYGYGQCRVAYFNAGGGTSEGGC